MELKDPLISWGFREYFVAQFKIPQVHETSCMFISPSINAKVESHLLGKVVKRDHWAHRVFGSQFRMGIICMDLFRLMF
jgi:hypothetical protein